MIFLIFYAMMLASQRMQERDFSSLIQTSINPIFQALTKSQNSPNLRWRRCAHNFLSPVSFRHYRKE